MINREEIAAELDGYVERLSSRSGSEWVVDELYHTGSYYRAIVRCPGTGEKRYVWHDYDRWRWDGCRSGWAGWKTRQAS